MPESLTTGDRLDFPHFMHGQQSTQGELKHPMPYPSPFFDLSNYWFPRSVKELFKWCRHYYKKEGIINATVYKMAEYPITNIYLGDKEDAQSTDRRSKDKLERTLLRYLKIKSFAIKMGIDYYVYGNTLVTIYYPFKRYLVCPKCKAENQFEDFNKFGPQGDLKFKAYKFQGTCPDCGSTIGQFKINDETVKKAKEINLIRHNPEHFDVEYNEITGRSTYYYNIPNSMQKKIKLGKDKDVLMSVPKIYIEAVKEKKSVKIKDDKVFHMKRSDVSDNDMGWGIPLILPVLRHMFHLQVLRKSQQEIAMEHLVPLRVLFPADNQSDAAPHKTTGLGKWKNRVEKEIKKWKRDPNYIPIMPVPLGNTTISGDGKMLLLNQEMKLTQEDVVAGMGVPREFVFGGLSWSGSSVSLRMLENHFLTYREEFLEFLTWLTDNLSNFLDVPYKEPHLQEFKMADDIQKKQLLQDLNQQKKISDSTLLKETVDLNAKEEVERSIQDHKDRRELYEEIGREQGIPKAKVQELIHKAEAKVQEKMMEDQEKGRPDDVTMMWQEYLQMIEQEQMIQEEEGPAAQMDAQEMAQKYAMQLMEMEPSEAKQVMMQMEQETPEMAQLVKEKLQQVHESGGAAPEGSGQGQQQQQAADMRPLPEQKPPRREEKSM